MKGWSVMYMFVFQPIANDYDTLILALVFDCFLRNVFVSRRISDNTLILVLVFVFVCIKTNIGLL